MTQHFLNYGRKRRARGVTVIETLVAFSLLTTTIAVFVPTVVRHMRLLTSEREYRLALDELSNQLERLTVLPNERLVTELSALRPTEFTADRLHDAKLRGDLQTADDGRRLTLFIEWDEPRRSQAPLSLTAWLDPSLEAPVAAAPLEALP